MNRFIRLAQFTIGCWVAGCNGGQPSTVGPSSPQTGGQKMQEPAVIQKISLSGFDPEGEPKIRVMSDGSLVVVFEFMPPSFAPELPGGDLGSFSDFDKQMERAIGVPVLWDDREFFIIRAPKDDTIGQDSTLRRRLPPPITSLACRITTLECLMRYYRIGCILPGEETRVFPLSLTTNMAFFTWPRKAIKRWNAAIPWC